MKRFQSAVQAAQALTRKKGKDVIKLYFDVDTLAQWKGDDEEFSMRIAQLEEDCAQLLAEQRAPAEAGVQREGEGEFEDLPPAPKGAPF